MSRYTCTICGSVLTEYYQCTNCYGIKVSMVNNSDTVSNKQDDDKCDALYSALLKARDDFKLLCGAGMQGHILDDIASSRGYANRALLSVEQALRYIHTKK